MQIVLYATLLTLSGEPKNLYSPAFYFPTVYHCVGFYETEEENLLNGLLQSAESQFGESVLVSEAGCGILDYEQNVMPLAVLYKKEGIPL